MKPDSLIFPFEDHALGVFKKSLPNPRSYFSPSSRTFIAELNQKLIKIIYARNPPHKYMKIKHPISKYLMGQRRDNKGNQKIFQQNDNENIFP